jgi:hypothetical protein
VGSSFLRASLVRIGHGVLRASLVRVGVLRASLVGVLRRPGALLVGVLRLHWQASLLVRVGVLRASHWHSGWQVTVGVLRATKSLVDVRDAGGAAERRLMTRTASAPRRRGGPDPGFKSLELVAGGSS